VRPAISTACSMEGGDQPPWCGRLPGFFLLRVDVPRSRLTFWPWPEPGEKPLGGMGLGAQMSASTLIFLGMKTPDKKD
jgi:hypothetical protein